MQASIMDQEKPEKDRKTILREEKAKEKRKEEIRRYKKDKKERTIKKDNSKIGLERIDM